MRSAATRPGRRRFRLRPMRASEPGATGLRRARRQLTTHLEVGATRLAGTSPDPARSASPPTSTLAYRPRPTGCIGRWRKIPAIRASVVGPLTNAIAHAAKSDHHRLIASRKSAACPRDVDERLACALTASPSAMKAGRDGTVLGGRQKRSKAFEQPRTHNRGTQTKRVAQKRSCGQRTQPTTCRSSPAWK